MAEEIVQVPTVSVEVLRNAIREEYATVAQSPQQMFHFHTGRPLAQMLSYREEWLEGIPNRVVESFAGTGNPFSLGKLDEGEQVVDIGSGAGIDSFIAAKMVGPSGRVVGVDMTPEMLEKARRAAEEAGLANVCFADGYAEALPVPNGWADVIISNGVLNLVPDKAVALREMARVLRPGGRLQIGDILVQKAVPDSAKEDISLWTG